MPMQVGRSWKYSVNTGFDSYVLPTKVVRELSVANTRGYEISGPLGTSRLAWTKRGLVAEKLNNSQFVPPILLLSSGDTGAGVVWSGTVTNVDRSQNATAVLRQGTDNETTVGLEKLRATRSVLTLRLGKSDVELISWFVPERGIVMQEQRTDNRLLVRLTQMKK